MRVLLVTPRYPPYTGGVENHVQEVARRFAAWNVDVTVLTTDPRGDLAIHAIIEDVNIWRARAYPSERDYYFAPAIHQIITRGDWDIVHLQSYHTLVAPLTMWAARQAGIPYVVTFHGGGHSSQLRNMARRMQNRLLRPLLASADRLVATAKFEIPYFGDMLNIPREQFALIPNGSDLPAVSPATSAPTSDAMIVSLGRAERYKGHHRVLAAMPYVLAQRPDVRLWIAGSGPYEAELQHIAERLGIAQHVEIKSIPVTQRHVLAHRLSQAALVMLLSEYETHPMAVLEAAALGCSILVADTSGLSELADQGLACAIPLNSAPEQVARVMLDQLQHPFRPKTVQLSSWDDCASTLLTLYDEIIRGQLCVS